VRSTKHLGEFEKRIKKGPLTIVLVYADWCGHCHTMMPHYDAAAKSPGRSIQAIKVNEQMLPAINKSINDRVNKSAPPLNVEGYPSIIIVDKKGNAVSNVEPVRNTSTMTSLMAQAGPLAETAGINRENEDPVNVVNSVVKNSIKSVNTNAAPNNPINTNNAANAMALTANNKNKNPFANLGIEEKGMATGPTALNSLRNSDVGEDELLGSIASKNNKNKTIKLASITPNKLGAAGINNEMNVNGKGVKESLKNASAPSPLNTFGEGEGEENPKAPTVPNNLKKEAELITSLAAPLMPPNVGTDMEGEEFSISNKLTPEQKVSGGGYGQNKNGGSLYAVMARTTYTLAPAAALLATAALVMKGKKHSTHKKKDKKRTISRRR